jgi:hypothetical protein
VCQVVTELAGEANVLISTQEFHAFNKCLDQAIASAVTAFGGQRERDLAYEGTERLGVLAHEMRNLLNTMTLSLTIIREGKVGLVGSTAARGANDAASGKPGSVWGLFKDRPLVIFCVCAVLSHFANAAMLPLLGEHLAKGRGRSSMLFMSACVVTTQLVITLIASWSGRKAGTWGRKPLLLIAFGILPVRAILYTLTGNAALLVAIQVLDGAAAGLSGVVSVLVIADLTRGSGRFNLTLGAITTAVGVGASLSQAIAGSIARRVSFRAAFLFPAAVASAAVMILFLFMPETREDPAPVQRMSK